MSGGLTRTQFERASVQLARLAVLLSELREINERLECVLGEAQNDPPQGKSDGSISGAQWTQMRVLRECLNTLVFLRVDVSQNLLEEPGLGEPD